MRRERRTKRRVESLMVRMSMGDGSAFTALAKLYKRDRSAVERAVAEIGGDIREEMRRMRGDEGDQDAGRPR